MIWIIPQSLTSVCAPATAASISDLEAASRICEQSLIRRSKPSPSSFYLREWRAGRLMRLQSGLMSGLSRGSNFASAWISSLEAIRASRSPQPASASVGKTKDTYGPTSQMEFGFSSQPCVFWRMSRDTLPSGCVTFSTTWDDWVTERRGAYSRRRKLALPTSGKGFSSWPTAAARDWKDSPGMAKERDGNPLGRVDQLPRAVYHHSGQVSLASPSWDGSRPASWATPRPPNGGQTTSGAKDKQSKRQVLLQHQTGGKLNPRWVETLMGLPVGWTMPSCALPVIPGSTSCAFSGTASSQPPQHELFESS